MSRQGAGKVGFLGAGNMAAAMIRGLVSAGLCRPTDVLASDVARGKVAALARRYGVRRADGNVELVRESDVVVLAVKPQDVPAVLEEIRAVVTSKKLFVSIAAGVTLRRLARQLGGEARVVRVMPNTPALLGRGMSVAVRGERATAADERRVLRLLRAVGDAIAVQEECLLDAVTGLSGSGPAYVYRFAEALIAAGEKQGLTSEISSRLVLQTLEGAAAMLRESGQSPEELRRMVSSPGGTTLAGLDALEKGGFSRAVAQAVTKATARSRELGRAT